MRFSVIIPCYCCAHTIVRALNSLVIQDFLECEVICIDDCSTDDTADIIANYKNEHQINLILLKNDKNMGPGESRNRGISVARGEYLCFMDSDDFYEKDFFRKIDNVINELSPDIIFYDFYQIIGNKVRNRRLSRFSTKEEYMALSGGSLWGAVWQRSLWEGLKLPLISNAEDIAVIPVLISRANRICHIPEPLYDYVYRDKSLSSKVHPNVCYNFVKSFKYTCQNVNIEKFKDSIEFHGIKTIIYGATLNGIKAGLNNDEIAQIWDGLSLEFPNWGHNFYLKRYDLPKRVFVHLIWFRQLSLIRLFVWSHGKILSILK